MLVKFIRYLLDEIDAEEKYNEAYRNEMTTAEYLVITQGGRFADYFDYGKFPRSPRESVIRENAKMIRRLSMKL